MAELVAALVDILSRYWRHHRTRFLAPLALALASLAILTRGGAIAVHLSHVVIAALVALGVYIYWKLDNSVPEVPKGKVGLVLAVACDNRQHDQQVRADFVGSLRRLLLSDQSATSFALIDLPDHHSRQCHDIDSARQMLSKSQGHFILYGQVRRRLIQGADSHLISLDGLVKHSPIPQPSSEAIARDFGQLLPRRLAFPLDNDALAFEVTSNWMDLAARYVIGLAAFASGDFEYAERLLLSVHERLRAADINIVPVRGLAEKLSRRLPELYEAWLGVLSDSYFLTRQREYVELGEVIAKKLLAINPTHYQALLHAAIADFVLRRDVQSAMRSVLACRGVRDCTWRYSRAFLLAYEGQTRRARDEYRVAFQSRLNNVTVPIQCEEFIHLVLAEEPHRVQLHFFAAQINQYMKGDVVAAKRDYEQFLTVLGSDAFPDERELATRALKSLDSGDWAELPAIG
jgi:hypothetical protein